MKKSVAVIVERPPGPRLACASAASWNNGNEDSIRLSSSESVTTTAIIRDLLCAKDLADWRYFEPLTVADLARAARMSVAHFSRQFRRAFGESPHAYLLARRLERAAALLRTTDWLVTDICVAVGLASVGSFTSSFKRYHGMSPIAYRRAFPPAVNLALIPPCALGIYGRP